MSLTYDVLKDDVRAGRPIDFGFVTYVPERTCHYVYDKEICGWVCSGCGGLEPVGDHVRYCPDCGARIEEEADE